MRCRNQVIWRLANCRVAVMAASSAVGAVELAAAQCQKAGASPAAWRRARRDPDRSSASASSSPPCSSMASNRGRCGRAARVAADRAQSAPAEVLPATACRPRAASATADGRSPRTLHRRATSRCGSVGRRLRRGLRIARGQAACNASTPISSSSARASSRMSAGIGGISARPSVSAVK